MSGGTDMTLLLRKNLASGTVSAESNGNSSLQDIYDT